MTFVDVETTGLYSSDRVVSLGLITVDVPALQSGSFAADCQYLVFDPGRKSHPRAEEVHGWDDWTLRHQELFADRASELLPYLSGSGLIAAHNASFDHGFISREFERAGVAFPRSGFFCTMQEYRQKFGGRANLDTALAQMGLPRRTGRHGALQDAWMAMLLYLWLRDLPAPPLSAMPSVGPMNLKAVPPRPQGALPRRRSRKAVAIVDPAGANQPPLEPAEPISGQPLDLGRLRPLLERGRPIATVLMWLARADGNADKSELNVVQRYIETEVGRVGASLSPSELQDVAATFFELVPTEADLAQAASQIVGDQMFLAQLGPLVRELISADGVGSSAEAAAVRSVSAAIAEARALRSRVQTDTNA